MLVLNNTQRLEDLRREQGLLASRLTEIKTQLQSLGLTKNAVTYMAHTIDPRKMEARAQLIEEQLSCEGRLRTIKAEMKELIGHRDTLFDVLRESLTPAQLTQLKEEVRRRHHGHPPTKVSLDTSVAREEARKAKALAQELMTQLEGARSALTRVIRDGCGRWGAGEFLKFISPVNTKLPPLEDLDRLKRIHHLK